MLLVAIIPSAVASARSHAILIVEFGVEKMQLLDD